MREMLHDRRQAGAALAKGLAAYGHRPDVLVLGLASGGVPVGHEIARELGVELDVFVLQKLEVPGHEQMSMGAIAAGGVRVLDGATIARFDIPRGTVEEVGRRKAVELARRERAYRGGRRAPKMTGRTILLADDGLTSPPMLRTAVEALRAYRPTKIVLATPTPSAQSTTLSADEIVSLREGPAFPVASPSYEDAAPVSDREVRQLLTDRESGERDSSDQEARL